MSVPTNPSKFVKLWMSSQLTSEIANQLNTSPATLYKWAIGLREQGVNLPHRKVAKGRALNVSKLNALIIKLS